MRPPEGSTETAGRSADGTGAPGTLSTRAEGVLAALLGASGVLAGAFGAHALADAWTPERLSIFETAARYQLLHALAAWAALLAPVRGRRLAARLFLAGVLVFSGSLYLLALTGVRGLGAVTPIGGLLFVGGWIALAVSAWRRPPA